PEGATLLGVILFSDKINVSTLVGDCCAHLPLTGLANIHIYIFILSHAFLLAMLLLIPKFMHKIKCTQGLLSDWLIHECLDIIVALLMNAACVGVMINDPLGNLQCCYTPLA
ncbi:hypothetical protein BS17DRAFT_698361, partial [Gyrodon lividus]